VNLLFVNISRKAAKIVAEKKIARVLVCVCLFMAQKRVTIICKYFAQRRKAAKIVAEKHLIVY
jgi:hypothetical protein